MECNKSFPRLGDIYLVNFEGRDSEQTGIRPAVVFQNNIGNEHSSNVIVLPLTSSLKKISQPTHVLVEASDSGLIKDSMVLAENPVTISKNRIIKYITSLNGSYMKKIAIAFLTATSAITFLSSELFEIVNVIE